MPHDFVPPNGMPFSIYAAKYAWPQEDGAVQPFADRIEEVWRGNYAIDDTPVDEYAIKLAREGLMPTSGRFLQHMKPGNLIRGEKVTNCSTSMFSFQKFWLLMQGSGVGRSYESSLCRVDWDYMPNLRLVLSPSHPDYEEWIESSVEAERLYPSESEDVRWFQVEDSAEGWAKSVEVLETAAFQKIHKDKLFVFDFTPVRAKNSPIAGLQNRPASGPVPLIQALAQVYRLKGAGMAPWKQAMHVDHYMSWCVQLGGVRRSARIALKPWTDAESEVLDFINIKRGGFLWSANNSVISDEEFWIQAAHPGPSKARRIYDAVMAAAYFDQTGEPAFLNAHMLTTNDENLDLITPESIFTGFEVHPRTLDMASKMLDCAKRSRFKYIVNPCGEIVLAVWGGYCVIADICLANAKSLEDVLMAAEYTTQFLLRANKLKFMYSGEVARTNRIGVSLTGIYEFAWNFWKFTAHDLLDEVKSADFWAFISQMRVIVEDIGRAAGCHTALTIKPSGTVGKVMGCTEGAHLPAYAFYMRWVVYAEGSSDLDDLTKRGYPTRFLQNKRQSIVGFPTSLKLSRDMGDQAVVAGDLTPDQQFKWIGLIEKYWLGSELGNQVSYTLKYDPIKVSFESFKASILENQPKVRCCSVMPQIDLSAYEYQPEEALTHLQYEEFTSHINQLEIEGYDNEALACAGGACPIEFDR
jgi:hypothetical protein